ncbi:MAG TPA: GNAT family N-acetyltransferase [Anaerolineales bacterium]|nr:GNAT family N-acetyltransferase [Anaerolineales bacterium]
MHKDFSEISAAAWNALVEQSIADTPFSRYEYLSQWWKTRGGGEWQNAELILVSASEGDQLTGIAPLFLVEHDGQRALLLVGSIEISDYLDLIVREQDLERFVSGLLDFVAARQEGWSGLDWYNLPDTSPTVAALKAEAERRGWAHSEEIYRPTPRIPLSGSFEDYLARIDKKQRHEIRRKMRRAAESEKNVRFTIANGTENIDSEIDAFFELMAQDPAKAEFLHAAMRAQMSATIQDAHAHGYLWLAFLEVDGAKTAASLNFDYKNKLWGYNSGVSSEHRELSPGWVLLAHTIQWCCENGRYEFDFMRGDEEYKYRFGGVNKFVMRVKVSKS